MRSLALRVVVLWGWRRHLAAAVAGAASVLALPPFYFLPVLFFTFPVLVWLLDGVASKRGGWRNAATAGLVGWSFGFGYFLAGLHWLRQAFMVEADLFAWMIPIVLVALPAALAVFPAAACALSRLFWGPGFARVISLAGFWAVFEWVRGHLFEGFPWNSVGYTLSGFDAMFQALSVVGIYGLSLIVVLMVAAPAVLPDEFDDGAMQSPWWRWRGPGVAALIVCTLWAYGQYRLSGAPTAFHETVRLRIVQPNIAQREKWKIENQSRIFARYLELSNAATSPQFTGMRDANLLIWPESAVPFLLAENANALAAIAALLPAGTSLITGSLRRGATPDGASGRPIFNSVLVIDANGRVAASSDKFHLVPFGEYLPLEKLLKRFGLRRLVVAPAGFRAGSGPKLLSTNNAGSFLPLVCYEAIFPRHAAHVIRPAWILNVTNDAWFGETIGPWQHFEHARARAIEQGLPLVRAANTGISAVIDPHGRVIKSIGLNRRGVIDARLPKPLAATVYARFGDLSLLGLLFLALGVNVLLLKVATNKA